MSSWGGYGGGGVYPPTHIPPLSHTHKHTYKNTAFEQIDDYFLTLKERKTKMDDEDHF